MVYVENLVEARHLLGMRVKILRKSRRLTQEQLGFMAGINRSRISRIEAGQINIGVDTIFLLACALDVQPADLLAGIDLSGDVGSDSLPISLGFSKH